MKPKILKSLIANLKNIKILLNKKGEFFTAVALHLIVVKNYIRLYEKQVLSSGSEPFDQWLTPIAALLYNCEFNFMNKYHLIMLQFLKTET